MSRSGYIDCGGSQEENWQYILYRGAVAAALRGRRGQRLLRELRNALDAMPDKRLIEGRLEANGDVCALGAVGVRRGLDLSHLDPEDAEAVAGQFDIAEALAREVVFINDEAIGGVETPEQRWQRVRGWVAQHLRDTNTDELNKE